MKNLKMSMVVTATAALIVLGGAEAASATALYRSGEKLGVGTTLGAESGYSTIQAGFATFTCNSSRFNGKIANAGGVSSPVSGSLSSLQFSMCNGTVTVLKNGAFEINYTSGANGSFAMSGAEVTVATGGTSCTYGTGAFGTSLGTLTGGGPATLSASAWLPKVAGGFLCAGTATWTATFTFWTPNPLSVLAA